MALSVTDLNELTKLKKTTPTENKLVTGEGDFDIATLWDPSKFSTSQSNSLSSGSTDSANTSASSGTTFSGLDSGTRDKVTDAVLPGLTESASKLSSIPGQYADAANRQYQNQSRSAMEEMFPQTVEAMSSKGMQKSTEMSDTLSKGMADIVKSFSDKGYQSKMDQAQMEMQIPQILGALAKLAEYSQGENQSTASGTTTSKNQSAQQSLTEDPGEPYARGLELLKTMLNL